MYLSRLNSPIKFHSLHVRKSYANPNNKTKPNPNPNTKSITLPILTITVQGQNSPLRWISPQHHHNNAMFPNALKRWPQGVPILYNRQPLLPSKLPLPMVDVDPHLIHRSLGPLQSSTQTASRSVQLFLQGSLVWQTERPTDHAARSVIIGYVCNTAMRPNTTVKIYNNLYFAVLQK